MKRAYLILAGLLGFASLAHAQSVTIRIDAGFLEDVTGTMPVQNNMLLQVLASPSGVFSAPNSSSFVTGDNILLGNFAMNSNSGKTGETLNNLNSLSLAAFNLSPGEPVELRFYPSLSGVTVPSAPTVGTTYGQVRSSTPEAGIADTSQTAWVIPAGGSTVDFLYITMSDGGTYSNLSADATNVVVVAVPEPSTYALMIASLGGLFIFRRMFRRATAL